MEPLRALVLDHDLDDAELTIRSLKQGGMAAEWLQAETPASFSEALQGGDWDVIVTGLSQSRFDAVAALRLVKESRREIPLIVVAGSIDEELAAALLRAGAADFVSRSRMAQLAPAVERAVREARQCREKHRAEEEIQVLAERWRLLLEHALDGVALYQAIRDSQGCLTDFRCLEWNRAAEGILGRGRDKVLGRTSREIFPGPERKRLLSHCARMMATGISDLIEDFSIGRQEQEKILDISCFRLDAEHFVTLFRDVTERKRTAEGLRQFAEEVARVNRNLEQVNAEIERRNRELEEFTHVASHDMQEPLRKIASFGDLLARALRDKLDSRSSQYLALMQDGARRLQTLLRDLLTMSRAGRAPLRIETKPLEECVRAALELLSARIQETGAVIHLDPLPSLPVDATQICQLYQNLISNALKFRPAEAVPEISITCEDSPDGPVLGVADNGIGIEPEYQEKIFEAFQRLHPRETYEGSGIGLAVCRKVVGRHGGRIWVESRPVAGSHFKFVLNPNGRAEEN